MSEAPVNVDLHRTVQLLSLAKGGDRRALEELYANYGERLRTVVRLRLGGRLRSKMDSCDVVQDAMLASLKHRDDLEFASSGAFFHWLTRLVENRIRDAADHFDAQKRDARRERPLDGVGACGDLHNGAMNEPATFGTPSQVVSRREDLAKLERAVDQLPDEQRESLILVRYEGLSMAEAGQIMERSPDAVRMLVSRAIVRLGKDLGAPQA